MLIFFTGGGSAGHVTPNIALIENLRSEYRVAYVGSKHGIESNLIRPLNIDYYTISTGKLRRQWHWRNALMPWQVLHGIWQSFWLCRRLRPRVLFSKGGFVAVPVIIGAWLNRIPIITHESDLSPGLATRLVSPLVKHIAYSFPTSERYFKNNKSRCTYTGSPIRQTLLQGDAARGKAFCGFTDDKPVLFVTGGGLGSVKINQTIWAALPELLVDFNVVHACGQGKTKPEMAQVGYRAFDYIGNDLPDILAAADLVVSRAGANSIVELLTLHKAHLLIPLPKNASRGDQIENAAYYQELGLSQTLPEEQLTRATLVAAIHQLWQQRDTYLQKICTYPLPNAQQKLLDLIKVQLHD